MKHTKLMTKAGLFFILFSLSQSMLLADSIAIPQQSAVQTELSAEEKQIKLDLSQYITDELLLPRNLYILQGDTVTPERFNIFYRNALSSLSSTYNISTYSPYGSITEGRWVYKTVDPLTLPTTPFTLSMVARVGENFISQSTTIELVDTQNTSPIRLLAIGDSLTRAGVYLSQIESKLPNISFVGTRFYPDDGMPVREGRGGWRLEDYFTFKNTKNLDSPFMFPVGISEEHYKGNTRDWKNICYTSPQSPIYEGFQKLARGWQDEGTYLYDENGYYKYPVPGDIMIDPSLPESAQWIEWNGYYWQTMQNPPTEFEFNFSKYIAHNQAAFASGTPTHISILLGANDFGLNKQIDQLDVFIERLNQMIDSIHAFDPNIKVVLCLPTLGPNTQTITSSKKALYTDYDLCVKYAASRLLKAFDTDAALARQVYIAPMTLTLDTSLGFTYVDRTEIIDDIPYKVVDVQNSIHPNNSYGQLQMGDTLAAVLQKFR